jgi:ATPase subunit of ABC transporter with duplicated ATPase domains
MGASPELVSLATPAGRWTPTRAGLIALWRYWDETFTFHQGRLLLRGPNGSGKSMALELLLPFLLDGDASPSRLTSSAKSRGGLYERVMAGSDDPGRTGFAWVEFRREDDEVFTVGARLRAPA